MYSRRDKNAQSLIKMEISGSIILLMPTPLRWGEEIRNQEREFKTYKEKEV